MKVENKLFRKRNPVTGQERSDLIEQMQKLEKELSNAEDWLDIQISSLSEPRTRMIFDSVFFDGCKQKEVAKEWNLSQQSICRIIRKGIAEMNSKQSAD